MSLMPEQLPDDIATLKQMLVAKDVAFAAQANELDAAKNGLIVVQLTIEKLKAQIAKLKREKFGTSSERIERVIEQLELALEDAEAGKAAAEAPAQAAEELAPAVEPPPADGAAPAEPAAATKKKRRTFPPALPRRDVVHAPPDACKTCGGSDLRKVGESVTEVLEYVPGHFEVIRNIRPACSCRKCETMMQAPMPELPIPRGMAGPHLLARVTIAKFCDHLPLYRQSEIFARAGVDLDRSQLAEWLGYIAWLLKPLADLIAEHVMAGRVIHADDTPIDVLAPGAGKTKTGRQWVYLRDERPHAGCADAGGHLKRQDCAPPAVLYRYTPDRKGQHCRAELARFVGWLHADGYAGFGKLYEIGGGAEGPPRVAEVACWAHARRGFIDIYKSNASPIAKEALDRIGALFDIERTIAGKPAVHRRDVRQRLARPKIDALAVWFDAQLKLISGKSGLAAAIRYARWRWDALTRYLEDGQLEISNNAAENQIRPVVSIGAEL
jgi:transposase